MKKVLLVDDEILVREGICNRIQWEKEGFIYCGDASDGEMALPLIENLAPDILLTDIKMPFMDGLQLSRIVKEKMPAVKIIILSGHDEFHYAREALRIGVEEYCLKPINAKELLQVLHGVAAKIDMEREEQKNKELLQMRASINQETVKEQLLIDLCSGAIPTADAIHAAEALGIGLIARHYLVVLAELTDEAETHSLFKQLLSDMSGHLHVKRSKKEHVWIIKGEETVGVENTVHSLIRKLKQIEEGLGCILYYGKGTVKGRVQEIAASFSEAEQNKCYHYFLRNRPIVSVDKGGLAGYDRQQVTNFLKMGDASRIDSFVCGYIHSIDKQTGAESKFYWHYLILDMIASVMAVIHESNGDVQAFLSEMAPVEETLLISNTLEEVRACATTVLMLAFQHRERITDKYGELLAKAKDYIDKNFDNPDLSLQAVAAYVNVSPSHFSGIFSQGTGQTFIDYLIKTRIKRAMELLKTTSAKSYEIAAMVGYNDPHYFNTVFKKITGVTTKVFRNQA
ncbi:response regulator [Paenibacillus sp. OAS669]|uniref:response regulator n=1 Tax=Paenibacillus sp. OAS669 TaxID=2663821 RepID=UPI00178B55D4|nr:response regulator [Paenibacillus sp. OAS669]MBE1440889.1 two-component system response regulator YesN [Paenibacillus sp. OAS669]